MKKRHSARDYKFPDSRLIISAKEVANYMIRDAAEFTSFGITPAKIDALLAQVDVFSDFPTDIESIAEATSATAIKKEKETQLRAAMRGVMLRVGQVYVLGSPEYKVFGSENLSRQQDAQLYLTAKQLVTAGVLHFNALAVSGLTSALLDEVTGLANEFEGLLLDQHTKKMERQEAADERVVMGNAIYTTLMQYTNIGKNIWKDKSAAKYNDYVLIVRRK